MPEVRGKSRLLPPYITGEPDAYSIAFHISQTLYINCSGEVSEMAMVCPSRAVAFNVNFFCGCLSKGGDVNRINSLDTSPQLFHGLNYWF